MLINDLTVAAGIKEYVPDLTVYTDVHSRWHWIFRGTHSEKMPDKESGFSSAFDALGDFIRWEVVGADETINALSGKSIRSPLRSLVMTQEELRDIIREEIEEYDSWQTLRFRECMAQNLKTITQNTNGWYRNITVMDENGWPTTHSLSTPDT